MGAGHRAGLAPTLAAPQVLADDAAPMASRLTPLALLLLLLLAGVSAPSREGEAEG